MQKIGVVYTTVDFSIRKSHPKFHKQNLSLTRSLLLQNNYPLTFLNKYINKRLEKNSINNTKSLTNINTHKSLLFYLFTKILISLVIT